MSALIAKPPEPSPPSWILRAVLALIAIIAYPPVIILLMWAAVVYGLYRALRWVRPHVLVIRRIIWTTYDRFATRTYDAASEFALNVANEIIIPRA